MNLEEFNQKYRYNENGNYISQHTYIEINCDQCNTPRKLLRWRAEDNIKKNGEYLCMSCAMKKHHKDKPRGPETKEKIRQGRLGKKHTDETKKQMAESAKRKWETEWGKKQKKILAKKAALQNATSKLDKSKRKVLYISAKNNGEIRACYSSGEFIACEDILEKDPQVVSYETQIYYTINNRHRSLDFLVSYLDGAKKAIEVKPKKRINEDANLLQLHDSEEYAKKMGWGFEIWTEEELGIKSWKDTTRRADEYREKHYKINYAEYRLLKDREKARKFYKNKIATDKVTVHCDYCKTTHDVLRKSYDANIKRNGEYICERKGGSIAGKKPKKKKENPYASEGKKQCAGCCGQILEFENFGKDKHKPDGLARVCKACRAKKALEKYHDKKKKQ